MYLPEKFYLSSDFMDADYLTGYVHSVFEQVINLEFMMQTYYGAERRMITLLQSGISMLPDSIVISRQLFLLIKNSNNCVIIKKGGMIYSKDLGVSICLPDTHNIRFNFRNSKLLLNTERMKQLSADIRKFFLCTGRKDGFSLLPDIFQKHLENFVQALLTGSKIELASAFHRLVGAGIGLTPSCDDAMTGAMACISGYYLAKDAAGGIRSFMELTRFMIPFLEYKKVTTDVSSKYLKCACRGQYSETLYSLVLLLYSTDSESPDLLLTQLAAIGHTSGLDMLHGFETAMEKIINHSERISKRR